MKKITGLMMALCSSVAMANVTLAEYQSPTGDVLMIHRLSNDEIWGSFFITDQVPDSFSSHELMLMQIDHHQPIQLDYQKVCGGAGRETQSVIYDFDNSTGESWEFNQSRINDDQQAWGELAWQSHPYLRMRSDRRPEVVDFAIAGELALTELLGQIKQGEELVFRYTTDAGEHREARFHLHKQWW